MSKINFILGGQSITVYHNGNSYTINKEAHTYGMVLDAVRAGDVVALDEALNIRLGIAKALNKDGKSKVVIDGNSIKYDGVEVGGLIASRIFETLRVGLSAKPMITFLENLMENPSKRAVDELFGFLDACNLPITEDGHFLAYKRVRADYLDCHSGTMDNSVGKVLEMPRNGVDEDKDRTCSAGLHFCSYGYLSSFGGARIVVVKINPRDVVAIPSDYNNSKGRTCRYEVVDEIPLGEYNLPSYTIADSYSDKYVPAPVEESEEWEESAEWEESDEGDSTLEYLTKDEVDEIVYGYKNDGDTVEELADAYGVDTDTVETILTNYGVLRTVAVASVKLSATDIPGIRKLLRQGKLSLADIARQYKVHPRTIGRIRDGEAWANVY